MTRPRLHLALVFALTLVGCGGQTTKTTLIDGGGGATSISNTDGASTTRDTNAIAQDTGKATSDASNAPDVPVPAADSGLPDVQIFYPDTGLVCGLPGALCQTAADCCGSVCTAGRCGILNCVSDGKACTSGGECCSTQCGAGGTCTALNPTCKTAGNACVTSTECCGGFCNAEKKCAAPSQISFCSQLGDICRADRECCTGVCGIKTGATVGTCAAITTSCQVDGTLCNGCGTCCSHFCGPFGQGGPNICQPASGCHVQGDLCKKDSDCCGGDATAALPGSGLIKCEPDPTYGSRIGTCGSPKASNCPANAPNCKNACNPEGNVCHYKTTLVCGGNLTNLRNDCCDCISGKECCRPDVTGIPRCNALAACIPVGGRCAFSGECCDGHPCMPDPVTGSLTCGSSCVKAGGACTTNADCCTGIACIPVPGQVAGVCGTPTIPTDAGVPTTTDASQPDVPICAFYGQSCSTSVTCCSGIPCVNDLGNACAASDTNCLCFIGE